MFLVYKLTEFFPPRKEPGDFSAAGPKANQSGGGAPPKEILTFLLPLQKMCTFDLFDIFVVFFFLNF